MGLLQRAWIDLLAPHDAMLALVRAPQVMGRFSHRSEPPARMASWLPVLPEPLEGPNRVLATNGSEGGRCLDVHDMLASAANRGWSMVVEETRWGVARIPALQTSSANASLEWVLDVRGAQWLMVRALMLLAHASIHGSAAANTSHCR